MNFALGQQGHPRQAGFAIIVVLASLLILTTVFAIASNRSFAQIQMQTGERTLSLRQFVNAEILTLLISIDLDSSLSDVVSLPYPFDGVGLRIQDVGGLIDLNTGRPELLARLFSALNAPNTAAANFWDWRRDGRRLQRVEDLIRIADIDTEQREALLAMATVHSGRNGVADAVAQDNVRALAAGLPQTAPSQANFAVFLQSNGRERLIGIISYPSSGTQGRILELR
ncbi:MULTISPECIES: hypothetical protein [unclassified Yoonia]|uniref:hypothetical protein n=1 Tax=unclassified Yoonia TaxID=2629118 RepID=UPI002AFED739|nr:MULTISPECIES: hypothetical protein [unclassified Yoonia]